ncbi:cytochrome c oxidase subunit II [Paracoccus stylophorae]|uniref:cytochrome-c oxidase n=1 Tax=Paracoccus stylophorae TaxID=659350 RepID=A0ABY7SW40_9RHOB|nr:cytochrome c oxidase subunit II [Paracoccus stylophorae]WCR11050.1 cytochrome c oxidase subunit II [Paracoccus stylophorae]
MSDAIWSRAGAHAESFDRLFTVLTGFSVLILLLVAGLIVGFSIRFRSGSKVTRHKVSRLIHREIEIGWIAATAIVALFFFWWTTSANLQQAAAPAGAMEIHIEAKQWMWKASHPDGTREISTLHVPAGQPVRLYLNSQDVIHSFFVPAFRLKQDVVPGRTATMWFRADRAGTYPLLCAEYCGTGHSRMLGEIVVMEPADFAAWLDSRPQGGGMIAAGRMLFTSVGCSGCHAPGSTVHAPDLDGLYGRQVPLADGRVVTADAAYIQDSILLPRRDIVAGYAPIMPDFADLLDEDEVAALVAYIRSLKGDAS